MIDEKSFGPEHTAVATDLANMAYLLQVTNRRGDAEPLMGRAISILERSLGPDHPKVAAVVNNLALLKAELGDWSEAAALGRHPKSVLTAR
jgi:Flp pilus assembly protein TadD